MRISRPAVLIIVFASLMQVSCNRKAQLLYLNNLDTELLTSTQPAPYQLRPGDVLSVQVITQDPEISRLFNIVSSGTSTSYTAYSNDASLYINGFSVNDSGMVRLPVVGTMPVAGLTVRQAQDSIQLKYERYLKDALVVVKLLSFKVTVLGEVRRPGTSTNYRDNLNIFEAIGLAGDFSDYGERTNVLVLRQTPEGVKTFRLNLQDKNLLTAEGFYLLPNDTVIVEPRNAKVMALNTPNISIFLSIITTALLLLNYVK